MSWVISEHVSDAEEHSLKKTNSEKLLACIN